MDRALEQYRAELEAELEEFKRQLRAEEEEHLTSLESLEATITDSNDVAQKRFDEAVTTARRKQAEGIPPRVVNISVRSAQENYERTLKTNKTMLDDFIRACRR